MKREIGSKLPLKMVSRWDKSKHTYPCLIFEDFVDCEDSDVPTFVKAMDQKLFTTIQGVVPFGQSNDSYLILFKIRDRLQHCFTEETEVWHNFDSEFN